jgi:shikimate kinase
MRIFLIGFMCSGKSRIGRELAALLKLRHLDIDRVIEQRVGPITPWFQKNGEAAFREVEEQVLHELLGSDNAVISTGGGTPCEGDNMDRMLAAGTVVYLDLPTDALVERCASKGGDRPLLFGLKGEALRTRIEELLVPRLPFYTRAHMRIRALDEPHVTAARIAQAIEAQER